MIMIVGMSRMRRGARRGIVPSRSFGVAMDIALGIRNGVMGSLIVMISRMRWIVMDSARRTSLSVSVRCFVFTSEYFWGVVGKQKSLLYSKTLQKYFSST